jgi:predicted RNA binding protein YcfA (HicA-like mRNA interferase family)
MNRRDLEKHLRNCGCEFFEHGGRHDMWWNPVIRVKAAVPRHNTVKRTVVRNICKKLQIPEPPGF